MKSRYFHHEIPELSGRFLSKNAVQAGALAEINPSWAMKVALTSMRLAERLGIRPPYKSRLHVLPYTDDDDTLSFDAPISTSILNKKIFYLRGWSAFGSCVKGFNSLGLMAEQICYALDRYKKLNSRQLMELKAQFLHSRKGFDPAGSAMTEADYLAIDNFDLAIWDCFAKRPIICSTSSNMGISLHQALRLMQSAKIDVQGKQYTLLNTDEASLVIWCPDERADFMNEEKSKLLRGLERELPKLTRLQTYINRQQRDPGALKEALLSGGYFFPTNPQSRDEMQNLIFVALQVVAEERKLSIPELILDPKIQAALESIGCGVQQSKVVVERGVEGGIFGLMIPYIIMMEEYLLANRGQAVSTWNQASIGAALAAAAMADKILRTPANLADETRAELNNYFPTLSKFLDAHTWGDDVKTQVHGVFDIANIQSLAQLLGVVVENHMTGRGTAFVGLGSSSYSNGNRCYDILKESIEEHGAFRGKAAFHPATHAINPFAQAIIFGEDLYRFLATMPADVALGDKISLIQKHVHKAEPAGAAALAGYMLSRLDMRTLSAVEIAYGLRVVGFSTESFLNFAGYAPGQQGMDTFLQLAFEEGNLMNGFAQDMMVLLDWDLAELGRRMQEEKRISKLRYCEEPMDELDFEYLDNDTCIYLTGDNTGQPTAELILNIAKECQQNLEQVKKFVQVYGAPKRGPSLTGPVTLACKVIFTVNKYSNTVNGKLDNYSKSLAARLIARSMDKSRGVDLFE